MMASIAPASETQCLLKLVVNDRELSVVVPPARRLSRVLREQLGLTGTKVGCDAGDCGACTVLLDGEAVCACLVAVGQVENHAITTIEGLKSRPPLFDRLQNAFLQHGAAQCGACTPGMLVSATALLEHNRSPSESEVTDALVDVLCRCTGYRKIITPVLDAAVLNPVSESAEPSCPAAGASVGQRLIRLDGKPRVEGTEIYGADEIPAGGSPPPVVPCPH